jgi:tyrosyl-tRNA synthetase
MSAVELAKQPPPGAATASRAVAREFDTVYGKDAVPADVPTVEVKTELATLWIAKALSAAGLVKTTSEAKRLVEQGGVEIDQRRVTDANHQLEPGKNYLVRVGSKNRRFARIQVVRAVT